MLTITVVPGGTITAECDPDRLDTVSGRPAGPVGRRRTWCKPRPDSASNALNRRRCYLALETSEMKPAT